ncbi:hypothetical protein [Candidatus Manganitrophus noduliformans]|uniref:Uncharacterized protein n=1 Tax=Candidatus Manganitrophus noduliformans TaxID=2606439 RepID=A0A7X6DMY8_9BACT|nr:hypothetical protein [Candidatus Manganitrophus noduliformans]NKE70216.1 hypothetical protein [Candidatus Manganitrophus noduliformans]
MQGPVKIIILIEEGVVENIYVPGDIDARYIVIDRDAELSDEIHSTGPQLAGSYGDLEALSPQFYRLAFEEETE